MVEDYLRRYWGGENRCVYLSKNENVANSLKKIKAVKLTGKKKQKREKKKKGKKKKKKQSYKETTSLFVAWGSAIRYS